MPSGLNRTPVDVTGAHASVLQPDHQHYWSFLRDAATYGVEEPEGRWIVGIGADAPEVVLVGTREQLVSVFRQALDRLGER